MAAATTSTAAVTIIFVSSHDNKDVDEATFNPELPRSEVNPGSRTSEDPLVRTLLDENETLLGRTTAI